MVKGDRLYALCLIPRRLYLGMVSLVFTHFEQRDMWLLHIDLNSLTCSGWHEGSVQIADLICLTVSCMGALCFS